MSDIGQAIPAKPSQIEEWKEAVEKSLDKLNSIISLAYGRLSPVLTPPMESKLEDKDTPPPPNLCEMSLWMWNRDGQIKSSVKELSELLDRLAL